MSGQTPSILPPAKPGDPWLAAQVNALRNTDENLARRVARLEGLESRGGLAVRRVAAYVVSSTTDTPSTYGGTSYTVRAVGAGSGGDLTGAKPVNRIIDDDNVPVVPAADLTPCVIVRSFDEDGEPISWLELWEKHPGAPCTPTTPE